MIRSLSSLALASLLLNSCGPTKWTEAQKAQLSTLAIAPEIPADAYAKPIGNEQYSAPIIVTGGGSFGTGAAVGAGAQIIVEIAAAVQQKMFEDRYADAIARVPGTVPWDLSKRIRISVAKKLGSQGFFKGRISDKSPNRLVIKVTNYRYIRASKKDGEILMTPAITGSFELKSPAGEKLLTQSFSAVAIETQRSLNDFANQKALASQAFDQMIEILAQKADEAVKARLE